METAFYKGIQKKRWLPENSAGFIVPLEVSVSINGDEGRDPASVKGCKAKEDSSIVQRD